MRVILENVSKTIEQKYYDASLRGLDWKALTKEAADRIDAAGSASEMLGAIFGLVSRLEDSHTLFIPPEWKLQPNFGFQAKAFGDVVRVYRVKKGGAAEAAGLERGDRILTVNGYKAEREIYDDLMIFFLRLNPVPTLELTIQRGDAAPLRVTIDGRVRPRPRVEDLRSLETVWRLIQEESREDEREDPAHYHDPGDGGIGELRLPFFPGAAYSEDVLNRPFRSLDEARALIVDLRGNPGGSIDFLRDFAGHFVTTGTSLADLIGRDGRKPFKVKPRKPRAPGPLVVLVDSESASAAEIFARWVQLSGRGVVVGDRTRGGARAARVFPMSVGGNVVVYYAVEVTIADVRFSDGGTVEGKGIQPDEPCLPMESELRQGADPCLERAYALAARAAAAPPAEPAARP